MFRLRREGIETKVVTETRESETEDSKRVASSSTKQHKIFNFTNIDFIHEQSDIQKA